MSATVSILELNSLENKDFVFVFHYIPSVLKDDIYLIIKIFKSYTYLLTVAFDLQEQNTYV